jgi:hypothetical protein
VIRGFTDGASMIVGLKSIDMLIKIEVQIKMGERREVDKDQSSLHHTLLWHFIF